MNKLILITLTLFLFVSCNAEKTYTINGKTIDEKYLLWEFASKLEEQEYRLQGFNIDHHTHPNAQSGETSHAPQIYDDHHEQGYTP